MSNNPEGQPSRDSIKAQIAEIDGKITEARNSISARNVQKSELRGQLSTPEEIEKGDFSKEERADLLATNEEIKTNIRSIDNVIKETKKEIEALENSKAPLAEALSKMEGEAPTEEKKKEDKKTTAETKKEKTVDVTPKNEVIPTNPMSKAFDGINIATVEGPIMSRKEKKAKKNKKEQVAAEVGVESKPEEKPTDKSLKLKEVNNFSELKKFWVNPDVNNVISRIELAAYGLKKDPTSEGAKKNFIRFFRGINPHSEVTQDKAIQFTSDVSGISFEELEGYLQDPNYKNLGPEEEKKEKKAEEKAPVSEREKLFKEAETFKDLRKLYPDVLSIQNSLTKAEKILNSLKEKPEDQELKENLAKIVSEEGILNESPIFVEAFLRVASLVSGLSVEELNSVFKMETKSEKTEKKEKVKSPPRIIPKIIETPKKTDETKKEEPKADSEKEEKLTLLIAKAESFDALYLMLENIKEVQGSEVLFKFDDPDSTRNLKYIIEGVRAKAFSIDCVTRTYGFRDKVAELLKEITPPPLPEEYLKSVELSHQMTDARGLYIIEHQKYLKSKKEPGYLDNIRAKLFGVKPEKEEALPQALREAKEAYEKIKIAYGASLWNLKSSQLEIGQLSPDDIDFLTFEARGRDYTSDFSANKEKEIASGKISPEEKNLLLKNYKSGEIFKRTVLDEREILVKAQSETWPPKEKNLIFKCLDAYHRQPRLIKFAISAAVLSAPIAATGGLSGFVMMGGYRFARAALSFRCGIRSWYSI